MVAPAHHRARIRCCNLLSILSLLAEKHAQGVDEPRQDQHGPLQGCSAPEGENEGADGSRSSEVLSKLGLQAIAWQGA
jgi:hypothetical protein